MKLPGVKVGRYKGPIDEVVAKLKADGVNMDWYGKYRQSKQIPMTHEKCGYFTLYWLEGDKAYTLTAATEDDPGSKYSEVRKLKKSEPTPCWYCGACKQRIYKPEIARAHRKISELEGDQ